MAGFFRTISRLGALAIALWPTILGIELLYEGEYVTGGTLIGFAVVIVVVQEVAVTPEKLPGKIAAGIKRRLLREKEN